MKTLLLILLLIPFISFGYNISIGDLQNLCKENHWESSNSYLAKKAEWEHYNTTDLHRGLAIQWCYKRDSYYRDRAVAWLTLYSHKKKVVKTRYHIFDNSSAYEKIKKSLSLYGYKKDDTYGSNYYSNLGYILQLFSSVRDNGTTDYYIICIKKDSYYDTQNGPKEEWWGKYYVKYNLRNGKYHGVFKKYDGSDFDHDPLLVKGNYKYGEKNGLWKHYYEKGKLKKQATFLNGKKNGFSKVYSPDGQIIQEESWKEGVKNGVQKYYSLVAEFGVNTESYEEEYDGYDELEGDELEAYADNREHEKYYEKVIKIIGSEYYIPEMEDARIDLIEIDGEIPVQISREENWKYGKKNGEFKYFNNDSILEGVKAKLEEEYKWIDDKLDGITKSYYLNGNIQKEGYIKSDVINDSQRPFIISSHGFWRYYYPDGNIQEEGNYIDSKRDSIWKYYYKNGSPKEEGAWKDDSKDGLWKYYNEEDSLLKSEGNWKDDSKDGIWKYYYKNGTIKEEGNYKHNIQEGLWRYYYQNGNLKEEGTWNDLKKHGLWKSYDEKNGQLEIEGTFKDNKKDGLWKWYYKNGKLREEKNFIDDEVHGKTKEYDNEGILISIKEFQNSLPHGLWMFFNKDSLPTYTETHYRGEILNIDVFKKDREKYEIKILEKYSKSNYQIRIIKYIKQLDIESPIEYQDYIISEIGKKTDKSLLHKIIHSPKMISLDFNEIETENFRITRMGEYTLLNENGDKLINGKYKLDGEKNGLWKYYYPKEDVLVESIYLFTDKKNQIASELFKTKSDGNITYSAQYTGNIRIKNVKDKTIEIISVKNGVRHGKTIIKDLETGDTIKKIKYKEGYIKS